MATTPHFDLPFRFPSSGIPAATNLITNGGFESNTIGWTAAAASPFVASPDQYFYGLQSAKGTCTGANPYILWGGTPIVPGSTYTVSGWIYQPVEAAQARFQIQWRNAGGIVSTSMGVLIATPANVWTKHTLTGEAPPLSETARPLFEVKSQTVSNIVYWDGIQLEAGSVATPYIETNGSVQSRIMTGGGGAAVAEQDTFEDIANCVECIVRTPLGFRVDSPNFGFPNTEFAVVPIITEDVIEIVQAQEPRALVLITERMNFIDNLIDIITVDVSDIRGTAGIQ